MRAILPISVAIATSLAIAACGPSYQGSYPSYEAVISQYVPPGKYTGVKLDDAALHPVGSHCDCPGVWYDGHWVYYYHDRWIYWHHGYWYHYPVFYVYYWDGLPYVYVGPAKSIHKVSSSGADGPSAVHQAAPPAHPSGSSSVGASPPRSSPPPADRDSPPSSSRKGGR